MELNVNPGMTPPPNWEPKRQGVGAIIGIIIIILIIVAGGFYFWKMNRDTLNMEKQNTENATMQQNDRENSSATADFDAATNVDISEDLNELDKELQ